MLKLVSLLALCAFAFGQKSLFDIPTPTHGKSVAPEPTLLEMPYEHPTMPKLGPASISETTSKVVNLPSPVLDLPKHNESAVEIPHAPIPIPKGGFEEQPMDYHIPQPVIEVPKPILQKKKVFFNVPQPIIQVPEPIIRHRPILYKVPHIVRIHKPIVKHEKVFYRVPQAQIRPKSGYN